MWLSGVEVQQLTSFELLDPAEGREGNLSFEALYDDLTRSFVFCDFLSCRHDNVDQLDRPRLEESSRLRRR